MIVKRTWVLIKHSKRRTVCIDGYWLDKNAYTKDNVYTKLKLFTVLTLIYRNKVFF